MKNNKMKIQLKEITVKELAEGFKESAEEGVVGFGGKLDIRPPYQREFIYKPEQRDAVIDTLKKGFPLNVMYWSVRKDGNFEMIDGQQRTISICRYVASKFSLEKRYFHNLEEDEKEKILSYKLMIYQCTGTGSEKLEWFKTINIAGEKLTHQELLNAIYSGSWVSDARRYFSKTGCAAYGLGSKYLNGKPIRQDYLETAIKWISDDKVRDYMSVNQHKPEADELWSYFQEVINWVKVTFPKYRAKQMKGLPWGDIYKEHGKKKLDSAKLEKQVDKLMQDDEVENKKGIYPYVLDGKERHLNLRAFTDSQKRQVYEQQKGVCKICKENFDISEMEGDHITPWIEGGKTAIENCQMLCKECNRRKGAK